jgi:hypothetical protein
MKEALRSEDAFEKLYQVSRQILKANWLEYSSMRVVPIASPIVGSVAARIDVVREAPFSFEVSITAFDSEDELALRCCRELQPFNRRDRKADRHELIYCWCGHSGDTIQDEKGSHYRDSSRDLHCHHCDAAGTVESYRWRALPLRCPCCSSGHLPFRSVHDKTRWCERCGGLGYLKPTYYS